MGKYSMAAGFAVGYVLGSKAGKQRYQQISDVARRVTNRPEVKRITDQATQTLSASKDRLSKKATSTLEQATNKAADKVQATTGSMAQGTSGTSTRSSYGTSSYEPASTTGLTGGTTEGGYGSGSDLGGSPTSYEPASTGYSTAPLGGVDTGTASRVGTGIDTGFGGQTTDLGDADPLLPGETTSSLESTGLDPTDSGTGSSRQ